MTRQPVPFLDLGVIHRQLEDELVDDLRAVMQASSFINGPAVRTFEQEFAAYCGCADAVGLASGLDALRLALAASDVGPGDEVIVPAMTFIATWEAVSQVGAVPRPVDISTDDYCIAVGEIEAAVTPRTKAIMPVHLFGQMADANGIAAVAKRHSLSVVEDAAQAHGAERKGLRAGAAGHAAGFSFYPGKNLGAMGDAGALVTDDERLAERVRALREHGQRRKYHHDEIGWTARIDTIQALVLSRKLPFLDAWNVERRAIASRYLEALEDVGDLVLPSVAVDSQPVWHVFVVRTSDPEGLAEHLRTDGIATGRHYPEPPHVSAAYASLGYEAGAFPTAEALAAECLSLPIYPGMTEAQCGRVVDSVTTWFDG